MNSKILGYERRGSLFGHTAALFYAALMMGSAVLYGASEPDPASMGSAGALSLTDGYLDPSVNPGVLGLSVTPQGGVVSPAWPSLRAGYFSNVLALTPYKDLWAGDYSEDFWRKYINVLINKSFDVEGLSPSETSRKIEKKVDNGIGVYAGSNIDLFILRLSRFLVHITTTVDCEARLSGVPFLILFSDKKGLVGGNVLDVTDTRADFIATTGIGVRYAHPLSFQDFFDRIESWTKGKIVFDEGAVGVGLKYVLGHSMMKLRAHEGNIVVAPGGENISYKARVVMTESGTGFKEDFGYEYVPGLSYMSGNGLGVDVGCAVSGSKGPKIGISMHDLGFIAWRGAQESEFYIACDSMRLNNFLGNTDSDTSDEDPFIDTITDPVRFKKDGMRYTMLPLRFSFSAGYEWAGFGSSVGALSSFVRAGLSYEQNVTRWPGRSRTPKLSIGAENGFLFGVLPFRVGLGFGGAGGVASTIGFGIDAKVIKIDAAYKANGSFYFYPSRGCELASRLAISWGSDADGDRITGRKDKCPNEPEDHDGFQDEDGCPDPDNDNDGIPDSLDKCPNEPEDVDGFGDEDGCPDFDNDADSIPDSLDNCPNNSEDVDGFGDKDGCPDFDNDRDGITDSLDVCPNEPEDRDGLEDSNGCPDYDNDKDSIPDTLDKCPNDPEDHNEPLPTDGCPSSDADNDGIPDSVDMCRGEAETFNWFMDNDGCPDTLAPPSVTIQNRISKNLEIITNPKSGSKSKDAALAALYTIIQSLSPARFAIGPASTPEAPEVRASLMERATGIKNGLVVRGAADSVLLVIEFDRIPASSTEITLIKTAGKEPICFAVVTGRETWAALRK